MFFYLNNIPIYCFKEYKNFTIIQFCDFLYIMIPRFCYHSKLSIAGNCRMCLVELNNGIKPVIACATSISSNIEIVLDSLLVKRARENVLEFLLINHPLDCPICDQGGECDLQDQTLMFGSDRGRFREMKRSVEDKEMGPVVKTIMTRCIHCTRCLRFSEEILGVRDLGMIGRGSESEIKMNNVFFLDSELSGNIVDLCPVGALTSKPFAFTARPWDLKSIESIDVLDSLNSSIRIDIKGNRIFRILPRSNEYINEDWISDITRFSYESLQSFRIKYPYLSLANSFSELLIDNLFVRLEWEQCFEYTKFLFRSIKMNYISFVASYGVGLFNINFFYFFTKLIKNSIFFIENLPCYNIDFRNNFIISDFFNFTKSNFFIFYNINLKNNFPVFNARFNNYLNNSYYKKFVFFIGGFIKDSYISYHLGFGASCFFSLLRGKNLNNNYFFRLSYRNLNLNLLDSDNTLKNYICSLNIFDKNEINNLCFYPNISGYFETGMNSLLSSSSVKDSEFGYFYKTNKIAKGVFSFYHGYYLPEMESFTVKYNYLFLPSHTFFESEDLYVNIFGDVQSSNQVLDPSEKEQVRSDFYIIKNIFSILLCNVDKRSGYSFISLDYILNELVFYYLSYYVSIFDVMPTSTVRKTVAYVNNDYLKFFLKKNSILNLDVRSMFITKYSTTLNGFYKLRNMKTLSSFY